MDIDNVVGQCLHKKFRLEHGHSLDREHIIQELTAAQCLDIALLSLPFICCKSSLKGEARGEMAGWEETGWKV